MTATGLPRERCENCGFAQKYSKQRPGEKPAFCTNHERWLCFACRSQMGCQDLGHQIAAQAPRRDYSDRVPPNDGEYAWIDDDVYHSDLDSLS